MSDDKRPEVWIGHVRMTTRALDESEAFMEEIGLRSIFHGEEIAVMELRGGTHIVLAQDKDSEPDKASWKSKTPICLGPMRPVIHIKLST